MRRADVSKLTATPYDVLVIGGGIYGAMVARDAALRGLRTALVERDDFGSGASHNSFKLMHGGIRYVQHLDFARLRASAREQAFWQFAAADLLRPLEFVIPLTGYGSKGPEAFAAAAALYALAASGVRAPSYRGAGVLSRAQAQASLGPHAPKGLRGGGLWRDGQIQDANRLQLSVLHAAAEAGVDLANYVEVKALQKDDNRVVGARVQDRITGATGQISATVTMSCTGPGAADLAAPVLPAAAGDRFPGFTRALNLVVDRAPHSKGLGVFSRSPGDAAIGKSRRMYFLTPWQGRMLIGTHEAGSDRRSDQDVDDFLVELSHACPTLELQRQDVLHVYRGMIPADVDDESGPARRQTRGTLIDHLQQDQVAGLITVVGVKYTTARLIAARAVDLALGQIAPGLGQQRLTRAQEGAGLSLTTALPKIGLARCDPDDPGQLYLRVKTAVQDEMAQTLLDLVLRRMSLAETGGVRGALGRDRLAQAAAVMGRELNWDPTRQAQEIGAVTTALTKV